MDHQLAYLRINNQTEKANLRELKVARKLKSTGTSAINLLLVLLLHHQAITTTLPTHHNQLAYYLWSDH